MTSGSNRDFMALRHRPEPQPAGYADRPSLVESFFGHLKAENPHLLAIEDPEVLRAELSVSRSHYNGGEVARRHRLCLPNDEREARAQAIARPGRRASRTLVSHDSPTIDSTAQ
ncbi:MAG: hypothetical protein ACR2G7_09460 [Acidimicrobiales bacterium]